MLPIKYAIWNIKWPEDSIYPANGSLNRILTLFLNKIKIKRNKIVVIIIKLDIYECIIFI